MLDMMIELTKIAVPSVRNMTEIKTELTIIMAWKTESILQMKKGSTKRVCTKMETFPCCCWLDLFEPTEERNMMFDITSKYQRETLWSRQSITFNILMCPLGNGITVLETIVVYGWIVKVRHQPVKWKSYPHTSTDGWVHTSKKIIWLITGPVIFGQYTTVDCWSSDVWWEAAEHKRSSIKKKGKHRRRRSLSE